MLRVIETNSRLILMIAAVFIFLCCSYTDQRSKFGAILPEFEAKAIDGDIVNSKQFSAIPKIR
jgi:hypothetical protein